MAMLQASPPRHRCRQALRLVALAALAAGPASWRHQPASQTEAFAGLTLRPRAPGVFTDRGRATSLSAGPQNKAKLEEEAMAVEKFFRQVTGMFNPNKKTGGASEAEIKEQERRDAASAKTQEALQTLKVSVVAGTDDDGDPIRRSAPISVLQSQAKQNLAIFGTTREEAVTDLLLSMRISASQFAERNILVVPVVVDLDQKMMRELSPQVKGSKLMKQGAVALPDPKGEEEVREWGLMMSREFVEAWDQGMGPQAEAGGLGLLVSRDGDIIRRGVGRPDWPQIFTDLGL